MLVADLEAVLDTVAPWALAEPGDNVGLLVGDRRASVRRVLVSLELTEPVLAEAIAGAYDTVLTHHPLLFSPVSSLIESRPREMVVRELIRRGIDLIAAHTNLDSAEGGLAAIAAQALGLEGAVPLRRGPAGWAKFVGFIPEDAVEAVAAAVFATGAGRIGRYEGCAFAAEGRGWFTPDEGAHPAIGQAGSAERTPEVRWETVVPRSRVRAVIEAYVSAHPYEEPAFDVYATEDVLARAGLGRSGTLREPAALADLAAQVAERFELTNCTWSGDGASMVGRAAVLPGSGRSLIAEAAGHDAIITGDLGYHDAERAAEMGMGVVNAPHGEMEWWCLRRWIPTLEKELTGSGVEVVTSKAWQSPWNNAAGGPAQTSLFDVSGSAPRQLLLRVDGGSRGNPGPGAIGVVLEDAEGRVVEEFGRAIGVCTNNVAEYRALLAGLELAAKAGADELEVLADSELLVKQVRGEYRVKNEGLKPLHEEAVSRLRGFRRVAVRHVPREQNAEADRLVNRALDEAASTSL